jgi:hypothetical protein
MWSAKKMSVAEFGILFWRFIWLHLSQPWFLADEKILLATNMEHASSASSAVPSDPEITCLSIK